ncbi:MAG TPA: hypothetical protein VKV77_03515 [Methylovirgula sp.]|nr:hypothetical protein [Methylovirgula sp.]
MDWQIIRDGRGWCAIGPDFENLATSAVGWGETLDEARAALDAKYRERAECADVPPLSEFTVRP